jgi:cytochrome c
MTESSTIRSSGRSSGAAQAERRFSSGRGCRILVRLVLAVALCAAAGKVRAQSSGGTSNRNPAAEAKAAEDGRGVFAQRCEVCHYSGSTAAKIGPGLKGLYARGKFADGKKVSDASLARWIEKGGKDMPGYADILKPAQIQALIAYLKTL